MALFSLLWGVNKTVKCVLDIVKLYWKETVLKQIRGNREKKYDVFVKKLQCEWPAYSFYLSVQNWNTVSPLYKSHSEILAHTQVSLQWTLSWTFCSQAGNWLTMHFWQGFDRFPGLFFFGPFFWKLHTHFAVLRYLSQEQTLTSQTNKTKGQNKNKVEEWVKWRKTIL